MFSRLIASFGSDTARFEGRNTSEGTLPRHCVKSLVLDILLVSHPSTQSRPVLTCHFYS